ncbi:hypothetical protein A8M32_08100 [Sinorhizobium alkalisoli]|uniref:Uncharacterized protein n=1 Tax=Sinorhizobium alkalisoli TaxID=1752398 RepID=A0A1E3VER7_9HYPH|nr:hypothetical protein A8M32_08100 [Sinorhizobium alkalisoli]
MHQKEIPSGKPILTAFPLRYIETVDPAGHFLIQITRDQDSKDGPLFLIFQAIAGCMLARAAQARRDQLKFESHSTRMQFKFYT